MSRYTSATDADREAMLDAIGVESVEALFAEVPEGMALGRPLDLPDGLAESEVYGRLSELASRNADAESALCFLGGGMYDDYAPALVDAIISRSEFLTPYTPYQPEISQGSLQAMFEFQTMVSELCGLPVASAGLYEGPSSVASAGYLAIAATKRRRFVVSAGLHPHSRRTLETYARGYGTDVVEVPLSGGVTDTEALEAALGDGGEDAETAAVFLQSPNYLGAVERIEPLAERARAAGALTVVSADPISLGLLKPPGECGAEVVVGEGQSLGNRLDYGGPSFGFFCATSEHMRRMPGRIAGETTDVDGRRGFVLTLQTREQHIRREKATHNICTAQALNALAGTIYLSWLGKQGLAELASAVARKTDHARERLGEVPGVELIHEAPAMREVAVELDAPVDPVIAHCAERGVLAGIPLGPDYPEHPNGLLVGISGQVTAAEVERLTAALADAIETVGEASPQAGATV